MNNQRLELIGIIIQALGVVGIMAAVYSVFLAREAIRKETDWNRKHFIVSELKDFAGNIDDHIGPVMKRFRCHEKDSMVIINEDSACNIYNSDPKKD
jgi:hypothetical protein